MNYLNYEFFDEFKSLDNLCRDMYGDTVDNKLGVTKYEVEEDYADRFDGLDEPTDLVIILDNGLRLICYSSWDYFDMEIVE